MYQNYKSWGKKVIMPSSYETFGLKKGRNFYRFLSTGEKLQKNHVNGFQTKGCFQTKAGSGGG